jgi:hypothetical protein
MIGLRDDRGEEGDWVWASISRGGQTNRSYSNRDVRKRSDNQSAEVIRRQISSAFLVSVADRLQEISLIVIE